MSGTQLILTGIKCPTCGIELRIDPKAFPSEAELVEHTRHVAGRHRAECPKRPEAA